MVDIALAALSPSKLGENPCSYREKESKLSTA